MAAPAARLYSGFLPIQRSSTIRPPIRCCWMMRSAFSGVTLAYHAPSGYTTQIGSRNEYLALDEAAVERLSPVRHIPALGCPLLLSVGGRETAEFKRQLLEILDEQDAWLDAHREELVAHAGPEEWSIAKMLARMTLAVPREVMFIRLAATLWQSAAPLPPMAGARSHLRRLLPCQVPVFRRSRPLFA